MTKLTIQDLHSIFSTARGDHPASKSGQYKGRTGTLPKMKTHGARKRAYRESVGWQSTWKK